MLGHVIEEIQGKPWLIAFSSGESQRGDTPIVRNRELYPYMVTCSYNVLAGDEREEDRLYE